MGLKSYFSAWICIKPRSAETPSMALKDIGVDLCQVGKPMREYHFPTENSTSSSGLGLVP